jgi:hydrogenase nickel incorporation protein HypB
MCSTCGCEQSGRETITTVGKEEFTPFSGSLMVTAPFHPNGIAGDQRLIRLEKDILSQNNVDAEHNRSHFQHASILAINLVSSPGSGKTTLLESTLRHLQNRLQLSVIEGDQQTLIDARRIAATGCNVVQVNTGKGCHLDAGMVHRAVHKLNPPHNSILFIENVGNLVCPALFDLGESFRVAIISVTEGDDKPAKYPDIFQSSDLCIINKIDLLPYVDFCITKTISAAMAVNPKLKFISVSAKTGEGMDKWYEWLQASHEGMKMQYLELKPSPT